MAMHGTAITAAQASRLRMKGTRTESSFMPALGRMRIRAWWVDAIVYWSM
jgi:hypothetical protein